MKKEELIATLKQIAKELTQWNYYICYAYLNLKDDNCKQFLKDSMLLEALKLNKGHFDQSFHPSNDRGDLYLGMNIGEEKQRRRQWRLKLIADAIELLNRQE